jgi:hypothetical protein
VETLAASYRYIRRVCVEAARQNIAAPIAQDECGRHVLGAGRLLHIATLAGDGR